MSISFKPDTTLPLLVLSLISRPSLLPKIPFSFDGTIVISLLPTTPISPFQLYVSVLDPYSSLSRVSELPPWVKSFLSYIKTENSTVLFYFSIHTYTVQKPPPTPRSLPPRFPFRRGYQRQSNVKVGTLVTDMYPHPLRCLSINPRCSFYSKTFLEKSPSFNHPLSL